MHSRWVRSSTPSRTATVYSCCSSTLFPPRAPEDHRHRLTSAAIHCSSHRNARYISWLAPPSTLNRRPVRRDLKLDRAGIRSVLLGLMVLGFGGGVPTGCLNRRPNDKNSLGSKTALVPERAPI